MNYAAILAGGQGLQMHKMDLPKQFMMLGSKPILIHTLEQFLVNEKIDKIIIVCPKDWESYTVDLLNKWVKNSADISVICGGENKNLSIMEVVKYIDHVYGVHSDDIVINHDAIRPFVTQRIIDENVEKVKKFDAVISAVSTIDTIIDSKEGKYVSNIPLKRYMYQEQTPQSYHISVLKTILENEADKIWHHETDTVRLVLDNGYQVALVEGEYSNIKIVSPYDLQVAETLLKNHYALNDKKQVE